ncbi:MAG: N-6 DNA methylase [Gemmatimonadales bacterium]
MHNLASAARLVEQCIGVANTAPLLAAIGFPSPPVPVTDEGRDTLDLPPGISTPLVARGRGPLRALAFETTRAGNIRDDISRVSSRLSRRAPQLLWLLCAVDPATGEVGLAAFDSGGVRLRVVALVTRRDHIVDSDSETLCALAAIPHQSEALTHWRWLEILGRESVSRRFFHALERIVRRLAEDLSPPIRIEDASELALLYVSRLLFLSFLETKGWLDRDHGFLGNRYADCMVNGGSYHRRVLAPLFFGTLNTHPRNRARRAHEFGRVPFLNGGLFARSPLESRSGNSVFSDESLGDVFAELLARYRFTAREDTTAWSEAAIDPEMLGKAFESLMSSHRRKTSGAFYTPQSLVVEVSEAALRYGLSSPTVPAFDVGEALTGRIPGAAHRSELLAAVDRMRVLDPACGSGAFLVHVLEELSALRIRLGDPRPLHVIRRQILTRSIFGVDINPTAVWLCELRLWLSMAIEDPETDPLRVTPLPNLDRNISLGDSLSGATFAPTAVQKRGTRIAALRGRYARATGPRKRSIGRVLDSIERECAITGCRSRIARLTHERRDMMTALRSRDLFGQRMPNAELIQRLAAVRSELRSTRDEARRLESGGALPFTFSTRFADIASEGGFSVIVGNPPWIRTRNLDPRERESLRHTFNVYRNSAWLGGIELSGAGRGFASQVDSAALFIERCIDLLRPSGAAALVVPAKLWRSLAGGGVRAFLLERAAIRELHDLSSAPRLFDAAVYPSVLVASRRTSSAAVPSPPMIAVSHARQSTTRWTTRAEQLPFDSSEGSPWLLMPDTVRAAFDRLNEAGVAMARTAIGRPLLGVKTGCNDAFIVSLVSRKEPAAAHETLCAVNGATGSGCIEAGMLRPLIRGENVTPWRIEPGDSRLIWTHDASSGPLRTLPPATMRWLSQWRRMLELRSDSHGRSRWWMLFRTDSADASLPRVVWSDIGRAPKAAILPAGDPAVPINSCYVVRCGAVEDAYALAALLNSSIAAAWLAAIAEPAHGGYRRYLGWTMSLFPLPADWTRARSILAPLAAKGARGEKVMDAELLEATLRAYRLKMGDITALLEWSDCV